MVDCLLFARFILQKSPKNVVQKWNDDKPNKFWGSLFSEKPKRIPMGMVFQIRTYLISCVVPVASDWLWVCSGTRVPLSVVQCVAIHQVADCYGIGYPEC